MHSLMKTKAFRVEKERETIGNVVSRKEPPKIFANKFLDYLDFFLILFFFIFFILRTGGVCGGAEGWWGLGKYKHNSMYCTQRKKMMFDNSEMYFYPALFGWRVNSAAWGENVMRS